MPIRQNMKVIVDIEIRTEFIVKPHGLYAMPIDTNELINMLPIILRIIFSKPLCSALYILSNAENPAYPGNIE